MLHDYVAAAYFMLQQHTSCCSSKLYVAAANYMLQHTDILIVAKVAYV
jgi:hypothetical protein